MAGPSASEILFLSVNHSITLMGKVWLIVMVLLRVLMLLLAGYPLYQDEQERFVCNTIQPGCANVCYDLFTPISLHRFWLVQLVTVCLPYLVFVIYVVHEVSGRLTVDLDTSGRARPAPPFATHREQPGPTSVGQTPPDAERGRALHFTGAYILHLMFRTLLEAGFGAAHYYLFGLHVPRRFLCQHPPCTTQVDCYISRPTEKTVMLNFMLGVAALSLFLNALDFACAIKRSVRQASRKKRAAATVREEEPRLHAGGGTAKGVDALAQQDLEGDAGQSAGFRKRHGSGAGPLAVSQETPCPKYSSLPRSAAPPGCNTNANNGYSFSQEEPPERNGSEVSLCPPEPMGTPRSIRVSKRGRLKPPPPPRRDLGSPPAASPVPAGDVAAQATCTRRAGQCTLVELGTGQSHDDGQEKRSEWV